MRKLLFLFCILLAIILLSLTLKKTPLINRNLLNNENFTNNLINSDNLLELSNNLEISPSFEMSKNNGPTNKKYLIQTGENSYYKINKNVDTNTDYKLSGWFSEINNWDGKDNLFNILFKDENNKIKAQSSNGEIMNSVKLNGNKWYYTEYKFKVPINYKNAIDIFFGYKPKNTKGERLITDIKLDKTIPGLESFPNIKDLNLFIDANNMKSYNYHSSYKNYWMDIINNYKFLWDKEPKWSNKGYFNTYNHKLSLLKPNNINLNNNEFTIILTASCLGEIDNVQNPQSIYISGNQKIAFGLNIPNKNGNITIDIADKKYLVKQSVLTENKCVYSITYKDGNLKIYIDEILLKEFNYVPKVYFDNNEIVINKYRTWNAKLYNFLIYNKELDLREITYISSYFKTNLLKSNLDPDYSINNIEKFTTKETYNEFLQSYQNQTIQENMNINCPNILIEDNKFGFDISNSEYARSAGLTGRKFFDNRNDCMVEYNKVFKNCSNNNIFDVKKKHVDNCIFTDSHTGNPNEHPCQICPELDNYNHDKEVELSNNCKNSIKSYCNNQLVRYENNPYNIDQNCLCFLDKNNPECQDKILKLHDNQINYKALQ